MPSSAQYLGAKMPGYVRFQLDYLLAREKDDPGYCGKRIADLSARWDF